jgi:2-C-methyl-D-erythritol 4-phosphate cytidylyltransferase
MKIAVILPAAGLGKRFAVVDSLASGLLAEANPTQGTKIEADLDGRPVFMRSIELFIGRPEVGQILLAVNPDRVEDFKLRFGDKLAFQGVTIVPGGKKERWETVANALRCVDSTCTHVAIHDAARPMTSEALIRRVLAVALTHDAVIPGLAVSSTLKHTVIDEAPADQADNILDDAGKTVDSLRRVTRTVDRNHLVEVQTPQVFALELIQRAYAALAKGVIPHEAITDDAGLVEAIGQRVYVVEGESTNLKITRPEDLKLALAILRLDQATQRTTSARKLFGDDEDE